MMRRRVLALVAVVVALLAPAAALGAAPRADLVDIEDEVMCTTCNVPLNIAESPQADEERALIRRLIARGMTKPQIKRALVAQFGDDVLALPDSGGVGITAYAIPLALGAVALTTLGLLVPRWRRRPPAGIARSRRGDGVVPDVGDRLSDADAERLDADLARYDA
jgi:cytochrome c-type biogenesis protein CcmH